MGFFEYISNHWYAGAALLLLVILTVFVWIKAMASGRKRNLEREKIVADLEKEKALRKEFKTVDELTFVEGKDDYRLITGMCANVQQRLENKEDMNTAFLNLSQPEKYAYVLGYFYEDSKNGLSEFFRANGEPLVGVAVQAVEELIGGEFAQLVAKEYVMLDENDETTSVDSKALEEMDNAFKEIIENKSDEIYRKTASYIRDNKHCFIH
ncbi:MAG: hypothetical protein UH249_07710 [Acutalibacteraceae bacterium]|nr:hypothetical protein [Acutalibacteraceae bacterium]